MHMDYILICASVYEKKRILQGFTFDFVELCVLTSLKYMKQQHKIVKCSQN